MPVKTSQPSIIQSVINNIQESEPFLRLLRAISDENQKPTLTSLHGSLLSLIITALAHQTNRPILLIAPSADYANDLYDDLCFLLGEEAVGHFPSRQILPYDFKAPVGEIMGRRISTLSALLDNKLKVVVAPIRAAIEPTMLKESLRDNRLVLNKGDEYDLEELVDKLVKLGFKRVSNVEEVGDFAMRGGLLDLFSPGEERPVRLEFFGDEIETLRTFDVGNQRTVEHIKTVSILPKREVMITNETIEDYLAAINDEDAAYIRNRYLNDPELPGLEWLSLLFGQPQGRLYDYLPEDAIVFTENDTKLYDECDIIINEATELYHRFVDRLSALPPVDSYYLYQEGFREKISAYQTVNIHPFTSKSSHTISFHSQPHPALGSRLDLLGDHLKQFAQQQYTYLIITDTSGQAERLQEIIAEKTGFKGSVPIVNADLKGGFICPESHLAVLTDHEIFSRYHRRLRKKKFKEGVAISDYSNLNKGDYVVHTDYGIARYLGLETLTVDNRNRDCLQLLYANKDKLFVPIEEFNRVSKYSGKEDSPLLSQLGGPGWDKLKKKTKKAIETMAADLIAFYAERKAASGFGFGDDTVWLKQLEASFPYEETTDQLKAINDVKRDMKNPICMDRLVCGDVGFGKTEVAVRAAFKAIDSGKQVAVLVPTTILAQQHYHTFRERFADFPVRVEMLSRFKTKKEQEVIIKQLAEGKIDLVVGTHRLFSNDVVFPDLGLLVVDEEHRFGVKHKEQLRRIKANVDTISMTATPIPRTLQMSLMGVRDMSLITTSPKDRLPIATEIAEFDPHTIQAAVLRELNRGGQVFFVHNRVQTIDAMHHYLQKLLPQAMIAVAHGQMHEKSLEGIMLGFMTGRYNVLLCTSIIESGLDIPNANTMIINRADRFGLAQLYQLRGRVGRSSRRAHAYLLTPPTRLLSADAVKRLRAIEAHSDLGSGFALAMRDLEIRGAGTILGHKQSGFIEEIGFDLYNKLLEEAIADLRGIELHRPPETKLETEIEMYLDNYYVNNRQQKVDIYRRLADSTTLDEVESIREEVIDRFGKLPQSGKNLFDGAAVKISASMLEIEKVKVKRTITNLFFKEGVKLTRSQVEGLHKATDCPLEFSLTGNVQIIIDMKKVEEKDKLPLLRGMLGKM